MSRNSSSSRNSNLWIGLIVIAVGIFLFIDKLDLWFFPYWVFSWPVLLIIIGLLIGVRKKFRSVGWLILVLIGSFFLLDEFPGFEYLHRYGLPLGVIIVGFFLLFRATVFRSDRDYHKKKLTSDHTGTANTTIFSSTEQVGAGGGEDYIELTTIFGGIKKKIFSKSFKGGQTTTLFGGTEIDLTQADIEGIVVIDIVQAFSGVELIVPSNWEVQSDITTILGSTEDKRMPVSNGPTTNKKLVLTGTCILGGIEIKSY